MQDQKKLEISPNYTISVYAKYDIYTEPLFIGRLESPSSIKKITEKIKESITNYSPKLPFVDIDNDEIKKALKKLETDPIPLFITITKGALLISNQITAESKTLQAKLCADFIKKSFDFLQKTN